MDRRSFLSLLAAPLIVQPTLEDIERLTWKRRFFPAWSPPATETWFSPMGHNLAEGDVTPFAVFSVSCKLNPLGRYRVVSIARGPGCDVLTVEPYVEPSSPLDVPQGTLQIRRASLTVEG